jgi:hypothetical protein
MLSGDVLTGYRLRRQRKINAVIENRYKDLHCFTREYSHTSKRCRCGGSRHNMLLLTRVDGRREYVCPVKYYRTWFGLWLSRLVNDRPPKDIMKEIV